MTLKSWNAQKTFGFCRSQLSFTHFRTLRVTTNPTHHVRASRPWGRQVCRGASASRGNAVDPSRSFRGGSSSRPRNSPGRIAASAVTRNRSIGLGSSAHDVPNLHYHYERERERAERRCAYPPPSPSRRRGVLVREELNNINYARGGGAPGRTGCTHVASPLAIEVSAGE